MYRTLDSFMQNALWFSKDIECNLDFESTVEIHRKNAKDTLTIYDGQSEGEHSLYNALKIMYSSCKKWERKLHKNILDAPVIKIENFEQFNEEQVYLALVIDDRFDIDEWTNKYYEKYLNDNNVFGEQNRAKGVTYVCHKQTGKMGKSRCNNNKDSFDSELGYAIAYARAIGDEVPQEIMMEDC